MDELTSGNGPQEEIKCKKEKKKLSKNELLRRFLLVAFIGILCFSLTMLSAKLIAYHKEDMTYKEMRESLNSDNGQDEGNSVFLPADNEEQGPSQTGEESLTLPYTVLRGNHDRLNDDGIFSIYSALKAQNTDLVGWISMPGFQKAIDYPVMQCFDNDFYMTHDFYRNKSNSGSIFMDFANKNSEPDRNIVLYGHAMRNNSMFGNLRGYPTDPEKYLKNTVIYLDLLSTRLEYQVFSAYSTDSDFNYRRTLFPGDEEFLSFINSLKSKSEHDFGVELTPYDKILTLSTCDKNYGNDGRIAIHAKLVRQVLYDDSSVVDEYDEADETGDKKIITSNVYLEELIIQYQIIDSEEGLIKEDNKAPEQSKEEDLTTTPPEKTTASESPAAPESTKTPETEPVVWKDVIFDKPFVTANAEFSAKLPNSAAIAKITAKAYDPKAKISYTINEKPAKPEKLDLLEGENVILVRVYSADGLYVRKYTFKIFREPSLLTETPTPAPGLSPIPTANPAPETTETPTKIPDVDSTP